jgi:cob(I)alamin adenosyltransferase
MPPPNFAVPNIDFAEPYAHLPQPQQNVAIIGGYDARNMQISQSSKPMQTKWVKEMQTSLMSLGASLSTAGTFHRRSGAILL